MVEAIIFDMDGVLFDTEKYYYDRRASFLGQKGISIDHLPPSFFIGGNTKQVWENILRDDYDKWDVSTLQEVKADIFRALEENRLQGFFDIVLSGEEFKESKPNPEIYLTALKQLNVQASRALIIEDSEKGIAAGVAADVEVWAIRDNQFGMDQSAAKGLLDSLTDVLDLIK